MKKKQYLYAIAYWCTRKDGSQGQGCSQIYRSTKINTISEFNSVLEFLKRENNLLNCVIVNIMFLGKIKVEKLKA